MEWQRPFHPELRLGFHSNSHRAFWSTVVVQAFPQIQRLPKPQTCDVRKPYARRHRLSKAGLVSECDWSIAKLGRSLLFCGRSSYILIHWRNLRLMAPWFLKKFPYDDWGFQTPGIAIGLRRVRNVLVYLRLDVFVLMQWAARTKSKRSHVRSRELPAWESQKVFVAIEV